ncbi:DNA cytosine methyltransferase [Bacillus licheniformis]|uniref:DNA cytosine methyltransferase n=1 Tax=Bacillus licheniformis TaxID=1402 RepID=UPI00227E94F5|nr:DNA cytosine methyltransferase [Bacillus licheniformis]MCY8022727.1 DNA cytosine methyltransferase [Bacillus licheniformis]
MIFKKGELFCGPGGLTLGAKMAEVEKNGVVYKVEHEWANDYDEATCETFRHNICPDKPETVICEDVRKLDITKLPEIDCFSFGFPCNDYSIVGESKGLEGKYGPLYTYGIKVLRHHQPKWFIAENVGGLESANEGKAFIKILKEMGDSGYEITPHLYKFQEYGVPQARHRIIIVGIRKDFGWKFKVPRAPFKDSSKWTSTRQALEEPPIPEDALNHEFTKHQSKVIEMLNHIPPGENAWFDGIPEHLRLNVKGAKLSNIYKRLNPNAPAYTVTGSGGGGTHMYHYAEPRALTNRERARLQTFPDYFEFLGGKESVRKQIGMAVPPLGAKIIIEAVLKSFAGIEYEIEPAKWEEELSKMLLGEKAKKNAATKPKKQNQSNNDSSKVEQIKFSI